MFHDKPIPNNINFNVIHIHKLQKKNIWEPLTTSVHPPTVDLYLYITLYHTGFWFLYNKLKAKYTL